MSKLIDELPVYSIDQQIVGMAVIPSFPHSKIARRVILDDHTYQTREEAIARIDEILAQGKKIFMLPR